MSRAIDGTKRLNRRKKILKLAKGFRGRRGTNFKAAKDAVTQALSDAYVGRRDKKGDMRSVWIARLNAAVREQGLSYSRFIDGLNKAGVVINRKALSNMAIEDPEAFKAVVETAKKAIGA
ncbi:MAG: 50S ribosomal protein L20 [Spirochaetaceae bacterium]|jgi:large subunit ribosomal protein L20|nr:50S ribosomal protein L20 [Spirochaetaceae bacterium]MBP3448929.1 50S ribosomal protein L20 [Spirochaetaceae bacterium]MBQ3024435.1 50S ribosomal protein L20 [Spirochaetaceae bacterium]MBQ7906145.1 50S ribosomal protein L20 [Spirochaetaceae bacterium]MEE0879883.1 50S ribosomal protein L20 [Treponemataceae bacterium]